MWCHRLHRANFNSIRDDTDYVKDRSNPGAV